MNVAVVTFPGSNCDGDTLDTFARVLGVETRSVWHKDRFSFSDTQLVVLPGGFSYGDYLRCGAMASLSPIMQDVRQFAENGGWVLGICNGFQILCETGLLPGALTFNEKQRFVCQDVRMRVTHARAPWLSETKEGETLTLPIAHGDGRYWTDASGLNTLKANSQILLQYDQNPNGSTEDIAGICNEKGNVFGLMPHPERATELRSQDGMRLWKSLLATGDVR